MTIQNVRMPRSRMRVTDAIYRMQRLVRDIGPWELLRHLARHVYRRVFPRRIPMHPFDLGHGVDTSGLIGGRLLASGRAHDRHITAYWGTAPSLIHAAIARWTKTLPGTPHHVRDYTFIDLGCGKGRVIMLASDYPFLQVLGVELNPGLVATAQRNLVQWKTSAHACDDIVVLHGDACECSLPDSPTLLYLFHPFDIHIMRLLLDRLKALSVTRSNPIDIIYANPEHARLFALVPDLRLLWEGEALLSQEETAADAFQTGSLRYRIDRLAPARQAIR